MCWTFFGNSVKSQKLLGDCTGEFKPIKPISPLFRPLISCSGPCRAAFSHKNNSSEKKSTRSRIKTNSGLSTCLIRPKATPMRIQSTFCLFFLAWKAKSEKGCKDRTFYDPELSTKFPKYNSYAIDPDTVHNQSLCNPNGIRRRGELNAYPSVPSQCHSVFTGSWFCWWS